MNKILKNSILISGLTLGLILFTGNDNIERIKDKVSSMTNKIITISQDRDKIVKKLQSNLDKYNTDIESLNQEKSNLEKELSNLNKQLEEEHGNNSSLTQEKTELQNAINNLNTQITELQNTINNLNTQISEHNNTITTLRDELTRSNGEVEKANKAVEELEKFVNGKFDEVKDIKETTDLSQYNPNDIAKNDVWIINDNDTFDCGNGISVQYTKSNGEVRFTLRDNSNVTPNSFILKVTYTDGSFDELNFTGNNYTLTRDRVISEIKLKGNLYTSTGIIHVDKVINVRM